MTIFIQHIRNITTKSQHNNQCLYSHFTRWRGLWVICVCVWGGVGVVCVCACGVDMCVYVGCRVCVIVIHD